MPSDPYALLGVDTNATDDEIKRAVPQPGARAAPRHEPATRRPRRASRRSRGAYETLRDPGAPAPLRHVRRRGSRQRRSSGRRRVRVRRPLRRVLPGWLRSAAPSGPPRAPDAEAIMELDLVDAAFGITETLELHLPERVRPLRRLGLRARARTRAAATRAAAPARSARSAARSSASSSPRRRAPSCAGTGQQIPSPCTQLRR